MKSWETISKQFTVNLNQRITPFSNSKVTIAQMNSSVLIEYIYSHGESLQIFTHLEWSSEQRQNSKFRNSTSHFIRCFGSIFKWSTWPRISIQFTMRWTPESWTHMSWSLASIHQSRSRSNIPKRPTACSVFSAKFLKYIKDPSTSPGLLGT